MITNTEYKLNKEIIQHQVKRHGIELLVVEFTKDTLQSPELMLAKFEEKVKEHPKIRLCMFDHITPMPCCKMPAKQIVELCRANGIVTLVDGFQALG